MTARVAPAISIAVVATASAILLPWWITLAALMVMLAIPLAWGLVANPERWVVVFLGAAILLPPLPLPGGDSGPHPSVLVAGLGLIAGLVRIDAWRIYLSELNAAFGLLVAALAVSIGWAAIHSGPAIAVGSAARLVLFSLSVYVFFAASQGPAKASRLDAQRITRALFWMAFIAACFGCVDFVFQLPAPAGFEPQFLWLASGVYRRAQGLFYEASTLGNFCAFFVVLCAVTLTQPRNRRILPMAALAAGLILFSVTMLLSFSRAPVLACGIALGTLAILERQRWQHHWRAIVAVVLPIPVAAMVFQMLLPEVAAGYWARFGMSFERMFESPDRVLSGRLQSWQTLGAFISDHPWQTALGIGYKTLPYTEHLGRPVIADNMYLSLLVETGVLGLIALLAVNTAVLAVSWRALRRGSFYGKWMFCFWIGEMFQMLSGDILTYWRVLPVYFWVLAQAFVDGMPAHDRDARTLEFSRT